MEVFVIPFGPDRYELYSEMPPEPDVDDAAAGEHGASLGFFASLRQRFGVMLRAAEERRTAARTDDRDAPVGVVARLQDRMLGWVVERVVEQRLLWNLRRQLSAVAVYPPDMSVDAAMSVIRRELRRDFERHRVWVVVYALALVASAPLAVIPGPNVVAYYLAFRVVGHFLSMRGATAGLHKVTWRSQVSPPLGDLRAIAGLDPQARHDRARAVGTELRLQHLPRFVERVAARHA